MKSVVQRRLPAASTLLLATLRDFIYPPLCILCARPLPGKEPWLCNGCRKKLDTNREQRDSCPHCSLNRKTHICACAIAWDHYVERIYSLFDFDETVQNIAHQIKYRGKKDLAYHIGNRYAATIPDTFFDGVEGVLSVPLHFFRKMSRGYNQSEYLARGILHGIERNQRYLNNVLLRVRNTKTQTKLDRSERQKNLARAFAVSNRGRERIIGKTLVLVDDVVTTGATTDLCASVLLNAGARAVRVVSLART